MLPLDEVLGGRDELVVAGFHPFASERTGVFDLLLPDTSPSRLFGVVFLVRRVAAQHTAWTKAFLELRILRVIRILGIFFGIEVIQIAEKFVEAMNGRQEPVHVSEMILSELTGGIAEWLEEFRNRRILRLQSNRRGRHTNLRQPGAK